MKIQTIFCRREIKFLITHEQKEELLKAISPYVKPDEYGRSTICNVYFDTPDHLLIRRSLEKPKYKEKLRLRSYGVPTPDGTVFLEIKKKFDDIVYKSRITIPAHDQEKVFNGVIENTDTVGREISFFFERYPSLAPKMYLSYNREAYYGINNRTFRVTFDQEISARQKNLSLNCPAGGESLLPQGKVLMEAKCEGAMPLWFVKILSQMKIYKTSFSKYGTAYTRYMNNKIKENK